ncbi:hypothetical protein CEXT_332921 [Caerostris extrusa]|uniref:Secreted protein n=1 Tax=Caerostris extrusa TaxID=172846 RepID=A0AAV4PKJ8_CAEEX|nr:hypothetical protein CEXT_332921 [Caerostris extrusa]
MSGQSVGLLLLSAEMVTRERSKDSICLAASWTAHHSSWCFFPRPESSERGCRYRFLSPQAGKSHRQKYEVIRFVDIRVEEFQVYSN